jgi:hypothetical protein
MFNVGPDGVVMAYEVHAGAAASQQVKYLIDKCFPGPVIVVRADKTCYDYPYDDQRLSRSGDADDFPKEMRTDYLARKQEYDQEYRVFWEETFHKPYPEKRRHDGVDDKQDHPAVPDWESRGAPELLAAHPASDTNCWSESLEPGSGVI